jgi:thiol-disulfide isomerase/thioredoxin
MNMAIGGIVAVVVVVGVLIGIKVAGSGSGKATVATTAARPAPASVIGEVTGAPLAALAQASNGATTIQGLTALTGQPPLTSAGKPTMLYIGAEFCPYCAAERWVMVAALAKFGTFSNLGETSSASGDVYPNSPTFSFVGSSYNSRYLNFQAVETTTNQLNSAGTGYVPLDSPTAAQTKLWKSLDPSQGIPFVDIAGKWLITTSGYVPSIISNKPMDYVAAQVGDNNTAVGKAIDQAAGVLVNDICSVTGDQPANVCNAVTAKG